MIWVILTILFLVWMFQNFYWKRKGLPPGPIPLPIIGNAWAISKVGMEKYFMDIKNKYGDLHTFWLGENPIVSINDVSTIVETFVRDGDTYAGRPTHMKVTDMSRHGRTGLIFTDGPLWREHRRFSLQTLRDFGMGKNLMQERVLDEVAVLIDEVKKELKAGNKEISIQNLIDLGIGSIINQLLFGYSFSKDKKEEFYQVKSYIQELVRALGSPFVRLCDRNPSMFKLFPFIYKDVTRTSDQMCGFFMKQINAHLKGIDFETESEATDYVEAFLRKRHELEVEGVKDHTFTDKQLYGACLDLWLAGQETTSNTLAWLVIYLITNPEAQKNLQAELDRVIGSDRFITLDDKTDLHFTNAVVAETQRFCNLVPMNPNHRLVKDVEINGYHIPANTTILHSITTVLFDERYFPEPQKFTPERFLDPNGKFFQPTELMPFGVGKRSCLGEGLARLELFLFAANMFNHFEITAPPSKPPNTVRLMGGTVQPEPFVTHIKPRF